MKAIFILLLFVVLSSQVVVPLSRKLNKLTITKRGDGNVVSIGGSLSYAIFYATIQLGASQTLYEVQLDTGSILIALFFQSFFNV